VAESIEIPLEAMASPIGHRVTPNLTTPATAITFTTPSAPVVDASAQAVRSNLVNPFNGILARITTTSQDASFNIKTAGILRRFCYEFVNRA
jgi:hypothetical protein